MSEADQAGKRRPSYWLADIERNGKPAYGSSKNFQIYRNVKDFGARGDGVSDDTAAINFAISHGGRCGRGCDSSTTTPALVYFPPGTYIVSSPIIQYYYTQLVGDALELPTLKSHANFSGIALIDANPYEAGGVNWYTNQNNFFRQVRNFIIDLTDMPSSSGTGIHWQVAQATSLQNIEFNMVRGDPHGVPNGQVGIFMENGSGGFMCDLKFFGGKHGAFFGNQQFTTRNLAFEGCKTAIWLQWNWLWSFKSVSIKDCDVGIDISNTANDGQLVGSVTLQDSTISDTPVGIRTAFSNTSTPNTAGTLVIDNVDFKTCPYAVQSTASDTILIGGGVIDSWVQGRRYVGKNGSRYQGLDLAARRPAALVDPVGHYAERSRPQYELLPASRFINIKSKGAKGDGITDDTVAIQAAMDTVGNDILYFDHGAYIVSDTIRVPHNIKITGEIWALIMARGTAFQDQFNPKPVWQVGQPGTSGNVEISDLIFETIGPQPGAILMEFNVAGSSPGMAGLWDVHFRIGGSAGTKLQSNICSKTPSIPAPVADPNGIGAFLMLHATRQSSLYAENSWMWVADHDLDRAGHEQINVFNGRGVLIESEKATWLYGTASEHSVLYQYLINGAKNVYMSSIQTETPYYQSNPDATTPFSLQKRWADPTFNQSTKNPRLCKKSWGLIINHSHDVLLFGGGLYSFFDNYDQTCLTTQSAQENMVSVCNSKGVKLYGLSTKAAINMIVYDGEVQAVDADNRSTFCATLALWTDS